MGDGPQLADIHLPARDHGGRLHRLVVAGIRALARLVVERCGDAIQRARRDFCRQNLNR